MGTERGPIRVGGNSARRVRSRRRSALAGRPAGKRFLLQSGNDPQQHPEHRQHQSPHLLPQPVRRHVRRDRRAAQPVRGGSPGVEYSRRRRMRESMAICILYASFSLPPAGEGWGGGSNRAWTRESGRKFRSVIPAKAGR
jgi:hypothetical protein